MPTDDEKRELVTEANKQIAARGEDRADSRLLQRFVDALEGATTAPEWEYGRRYYDEAGDPHIRKTKDVRSPDGHRADGTPYWNYDAIRRRKAGPWEVVTDDRD